MTWTGTVDDIFRCYGCQIRRLKKLRGVTFLDARDFGRPIVPLAFAGTRVFPLSFGCPGLLLLLLLLLLESRITPVSGSKILTQTLADGLALGSPQGI